MTGSAHPADIRVAPSQQRAIAIQSFAAAMRAAFGSGTLDGTEAELVEGVAGRTLAGRSAGADLLVLGSASPSTSTGRSIGPAIRACLSRAHCPVVVVAAADQQTIRPPAGEPSAAART
jgi:nucleotide-binding universal stress UspA family protein